MWLFLLVVYIYIELCAKRYFCFILVFFITSLVWSQTSIKKDIEGQYLDKLYIKKDSSLTTEFQRYAIDFFKKGVKLSDSIFKQTEFHRVGGC